MQERIDRIESLFIIEKNRIIYEIVDFNETFEIIHAIKRVRIE